MPGSTTFDTFVRAQARELRAKDAVPASLREWETRREALRKSMFAALGGVPAKPCDLTPKVVRSVRRTGYRIENVLLQTRPDVWMTANAYVPEPATARLPAVLVVHGHWPGARRDPVVQARCLGLVKLGFFVLAVDAFGAGERHPTIAKGTYHGGLLGSTLWPAGLTLLGVQVYDNRRAVDYLLSRPEVDGKRLGITGASGGGNQTMYAGALDERFAAAVPVCSVGTYQAYLQAACCVCEVLPGALRFTEEGDVLGLVAPRALMVINATRDAYQFSVGEARKSLERAKAVFKLHGKEEKVQHVVFESGHDYSRPMREAMYGWMTRWLKGEGKGTPVPEPKHDVEKPEELACYPDLKRPKQFLFPPTLASRQAESLLAWHKEAKLDHKEAWDAHAGLVRTRLQEALGPTPAALKPEPRWEKAEKRDGLTSVPFTLEVEKGLEIAGTVRHSGRGEFGKLPACLVLHLDGREAALKHAVTAELLKRHRIVYAPDLRATGQAQPKGGAVAGAPDHNAAEHALWVGRPLLGQWAADVRALLDLMASRPGVNVGRLSVVGLGQAGVLALVAGALFADRLHAAVAVDSLTSFATQDAYTAGTRMGLLVPGILRAGDLAHLAALAAPRKLIVAGGFTPQGKKLDAKGLEQAFAFTRKAFRLTKAEDALTVTAAVDPAAVAGRL